MHVVHDSALPVEAFEAERVQHQQDLAKLRMQLIMYRMALEEAGIEPPDRDDGDLLEMWRACRRVLEAAHLCVANLGTSMELLKDWR